MNVKHFPAPRAGIPALAVLLAVAAVLPCSCSSEKARPAAYEFTNIRRGSLERTVSSSGTINPVSTINVLPRMSGKVEKIYVDYNDTVHSGDILAELNTDMLKLKWDQQYASVMKARTTYELQMINYSNQEALAGRNLISEYDLKTSKAVLDGQAADLAVAEANLKEIETEINQYAYITSPIDGIVLDRNISVGDTVVDSSSSTSKIFVLAENLREMQIEAMVGELDVASIHRGQLVRFTLESMPGRSFTGEVENLRMVPVVSNSVVSYMVIIKVENQDGSLMPGMTCAVDFIVERAEDVLMVSNASLRYQPTSLSAEQMAEMVFNASIAGLGDEERQAAIQAREQAAAQTASQPARQQANTGIAGLLSGGGQPRGINSRSTPGQGSRAAVVTRNLWFMNGDGRLEVIQVQTGITNGSFTEIYTQEDIEGKQVVLRERF